MTAPSGQLDAGVPVTKVDADAAESEWSRLAAHLAFRQRLSRSEERVLDRDGDGRITARDLYLARIGARLAPMPEIVPATRIVSRGQVLELRILGSAPSGLNAQLGILGALRPLDLQITQAGRQTSASIQLVKDVRPDERVNADLWLMAPGYTPRCIALVFAKRPNRSDQEPAAY